MQSAINDFLGFVYKSRSPKTHRTYTHALQVFADVVGDHSPLTKETYIKFLRSTSDMNPSTQSLYRSAVRGLYLYAADSDPAINTAFFAMTDRRYAVKKGKRLPIFNRAAIEKTIEYVQTIRNDLTDLRDRTFILLLADTGLRVSEACSLKIGDVDLLEHKAVVIGKGNKQAVVNLSVRVVSAIREYLGARSSFTASLPLFIRHDKRAGDAIKPITPGYIWHYVKRRATEAGVDRSSLRVHDFRHYFVTIVLAASGNIKLAQELARHESIDTTSRYAHLVGSSSKAYHEIFNK
jgi:integrase/recombinase XerC